MLRLTPQQMNGFAPAGEALFVERLAHFLRDTAPGLPVRTAAGETTVAQAPPGLLHGCIRIALARARALGETGEAALAVFVALSFVIGPGFDALPEVRALLTDPQVPAGRALDHFVAATPPPRVAALQAALAGARWEQAA